MSQDLLFDESWQEYRRKEIEIGVSVVHEMWKANADLKEIRGAIDMLRRIIRIPEGFAKTEEAKAAAAALIQTAMHKVDMDLLRKMMAE